MINTKQEYLEEVKGKTVKCAYIYTIDNSPVQQAFSLPVDYTTKELVVFLQKLNFEYDNGYGSQKLYGTIWYTDGTWSSRSEYDGCEWWEYQQVPDIPEFLVK